MLYRRMPIEVESPEQIGYGTIRNNLSESSYTDARFQSIAGDFSLGELVLCYGDHLGHGGLRELIAAEAGLGKENVLLTIGAAGALYIIATSLLEKGDELVVVRPNYATNLETPRAIGAELKYIDLLFEEGFVLNMEKVRAALSPKTKYISVTHPHNPTGACLSEEQLRQLAALAEERGCWLLVDETYRDMTFGPRLPLAATFSSRIISVSSLSKTYGLPGLRTGWIVAQDRRLLETFLAAKEQIHICGPVLEEELAYRYMQKKELFFPAIQKDIENKFKILSSWVVQQTDFEWVEPRGGAVCFPRLRQPQTVDLELFYRLLLEKYSTYVGPGHWFEMPRHYMRIGYGWPSTECLQEGLEALTKSLREAKLG